MGSGYKYPIPTTTKQIKSFLGLTGYYRKFIANYAVIAKPITKGLKKNLKINAQDPQYITACNKLKQLISEDPVLKIPDFNR